MENTSHEVGICSIAWGKQKGLWICGLGKATKGWDSKRKETWWIENQPSNDSNINSDGDSDGTSMGMVTVNDVKPNIEEQ